MFSEYFIDRPRFAGVISIIMILLGLLAIAVLPVSQYPEITPPQIVVSTTYPGASAQVVIDTVAVPVENQINGVENMLYMTSSSNDDGSYKLTITFNIGTDPDIAQVKVQNRLNQVMSQLPEIVQQQGLEVNTQMSNMLALLALRSPQNTYDDLYLSNYAYANLKNPLSRVDGIGDVQIFGPQYSMRVWLKPEKLSSLGLTSSDIVQIIESQNVQASIGGIGTAPSPAGTNQVLSLTAKGLLNTVEDFDNIVVATSENGGLVRLKDVARVELGADTYTMNAKFDNAPAVIMSLSQTPGSNSLNIMDNVAKAIADLLLKERPACVVGFGGYASFPCSMAAILLGTDLIVHEQNSVMSRTNRFLGRYATAVAASFKKTKYAPAGRKTVQTGMPIRKAIAELYGRPYPKTGKTLPFNMLVLGGSQGAKVFAEVIPQAIKMLASKQQKRIRMTQQCRREDLDAVRAAYDGAKCTLELSHFFDNMPELYAQTHLIISRAGASSVSEIAAAGIPSILVPLPTAADDHQTSNAAEFKTNKGGIVIAQKDFSPTALAAVLNDLLEDPAVLKTMAENTAKFAITDAAVRLADLIENKIIIPAAKRPAEK